MKRLFDFVSPGQALALERAGYAIVPREMTDAQSGRRILTACKDYRAQYAAVVEEGRLK